MIFDPDPAKKVDSACANGRLAFHDFLHPAPDSGVQSLVVAMSEVVRQSGEPKFENIIQRMRDGNLDRDDADFLMRRRLSALSPEERADFYNNALFIMPTWKQTIPITKRYLAQLGQPVARADIVYDSPMNGRNHAVDEINLPVWGALAVGAIVMLLCNIVPEEKLMNGSIGEVKKIVYSTREGPRGPNGPRCHPAYAIVDFPDFEISEEDKLIDGMPRTCVPVTPITLRCESSCCSATTMPLRVSKAITCHKCQGQTVGDGHPFCKCVVGLPCKNNKSPGLAQVSIS
jgi:hypothetical protein